MPWTPSNANLWTAPAIERCLPSDQADRADVTAAVIASPLGLRSARSKDSCWNPRPSLAFNHSAANDGEVVMIIVGTTIFTACMVFVVLLGLLSENA
jgi:hypothetical protein